MCAEGRRLQERADFEARVSAYVVNYTSAREPRDFAPVAESQSLEMEDTQPYASQDYYNDANEPWQEIDEDGNLPISQPSLPLPAVRPRDAVEATALLSKFRPARGTAEDLKRFLDARADPDITLDGDVSPLMKILTFAHKNYVGAMRDLLLRAGAVENDEIKERWEIRRRADACEEPWLRNFHRDPR